VPGSCERRNELLDSVKCEEFLDQLLHEVNFMAVRNFVLLVQMYKVIHNFL